jgi:predicted dehydrogenase
MPIAAAIIGCGKLGRLHARGYKAAGATVALVADRNSDAARAVATEFGSRWTADYREVLEDPSIGAVSVCVPTDQHFAVLVAALEHQKHILCEKPLTSTLEDARHLLDLAGRTPIVAQVGFMKRFDPAIRAAHDALEEIGTPQCGTFRSYLPFTDAGWEQAKRRWVLNKTQSGGGALIHSGSHALDAVLWFCGPVVEVDGHVRYRDDLADIEYMAQAMLWTTSGAAILLDVGWLGLTGIGHRHDGWDEVFTVTGGKGVVTVRTCWWNQCEVAHTVVEIYTEASHGSRILTFGPPDHFNREIAGFLQAIETGRQAEVTLRDGYNAQVVIDAIYRSHKQGARVRVSP